MASMAGLPKGEKIRGEIVKTLQNKTVLKRHIRRMRQQYFLDALPAFQKTQHKTRDLGAYVRAKIASEEAKMAARGERLPIYLSLWVHHETGEGVICCPCCGQMLKGNGRSFKFIIRRIQGSGGEALVIECILCPEKICPHCRLAGRHYCHKIIPLSVCYWRDRPSADYEKGLLGDADGDCPLSDNTIVRLAKATAERLKRLVTRPIEGLGQAAAAVARARGFDAVTAAFARLVGILFDAPPTGWFARLGHQGRLAATRRRQIDTVCESKSYTSIARKAVL